MVHVSVSSGQPVTGAGVRQQYVKHDLLAALVARAPAGSPIVLTATPHKATQVVVIPDDPEIATASRSALAKAGKGAKVVRISRFLKDHDMRPLDECELSYIRARLSHIGEPCVCAEGCYSKLCDTETGTCTKARPAKKQNPPPKGRRRQAPNPKRQGTKRTTKRQPKPKRVR